MSGRISYGPEYLLPENLERLRAVTMEVAIVALPLRVRNHEFKSFPLITEKLYAVLPKRHPLARQRSISLGELRDNPFLLLRDGHCFREAAVAACNRARLNPNVVFESGQFSSILSMVAAGLGISIVPAMAIEKRGECCFIPIQDERAVRTIGAVKLNGRSLPRACEAFLAHVGAES